MVEHVTFAGSPAARSPDVITRIYLLLFPIPVVCFVGAMATDAVYANSAYLMWLHFSEWLIAVGLAVGALAALVLVVDFIVHRAVRHGAIGWLHLLLFFGALLVELFDALVHSRDGWTAVVPTGMTLSVIGALLALGAVAAMWRAPLVPLERMEGRP